MVLLLMGIVASFAVLSIPRNDKHEQVAREAGRLRALLGMAAQEAILRGRAIGMAVGGRGYRFVTQDDKGHWQTLADPVLRAHTLPAELRLQLHAHGLSGVRSPPAPSPDSPQVLLFSTGELTPFDLQVTDKTGAAHVRLVAAENGKMTLVDGNEP